MIIKENPDEIISYLEDSSNFRNGKADKVFIPESEEEIVEILNYSSRKRIPVTVSGAGTGTVAGRIPEGGFVISMEKFDKIKAIEPERKKAILQAGVIINRFLSEIEKFNLFYPPFPTERNAFIGGNISTNASGEYSFKFGPTRKYIKKIRMVLTSGKIVEIERGKSFEKDGKIFIDGMEIPLPSYRTPPVKCTAGYYSKEGMDSIDLIIGSEGTLGVITEAEVNLIDALPQRFIIVIFFPDDKKILNLVRMIKKRKDLNVFSLEYFDNNSLEFLKKDFPGIPQNSFALYIEAESGIDKMEEWGKIAEEFGAIDVWVGEDEKNYQRLIDFRHRLPENINSYFKSIKSVKVSVDVAVPEEGFQVLYNFYREIMEKENLHMVLFGHIGENHLHFNMFPEDENERLKAYRIYEECIKKGLSLGGTVSAEHGIGKLKHRWLKMMYGEKGIREMAEIKKIFDPFCIIGLNNIFPKDILFI
ncbi:MAG TPA: FAD-binding oxidoreductase [Firmicutes bacterium]|nr:MAG: FAD-binding oxidoreductase [Candidatus Omnitrophota bacterium]HDD64993.1 FAD-binding oxidoreductase [Bacillota bacterium]